MSILTGKCGDKLTYTLNNDYELYISGSGDMDSYTPMDEPPWYQYRSKINKLEFDGNITSIGKWAFNGCTFVTEDIKLPDTIITIGDYAFNKFGKDDVRKIYTISLPTAIKRIGTSAFKNTTYAFATNESGTIILPDTIISIGESAFSGCKNMSGKLVIPRNLKRIEPYTFEHSGISGTIEIPDTVTYIGSGAFNCCAKISGKVYIPKTVTSLGSAVFSRCTGLNNIVQFDTPDKIFGELMFYKCQNIGMSIVLPDCLTSIGYNALDGCENVYSVTIPNSTESTNIKCGYNALVNLAQNSVIYTDYPATDFIGVYSTERSALAVKSETGYTFIHNIRGFSLDSRNAPVKQGYIFEGWYTNPEFEGKKITNVTTGHTYYPKFECCS